jgi:hypothetical protein
MCGALVAAATLPAAAAPFTLTSPGTPDGTKMSNDYAAARCGGKELSPPLAWTGAPAASASFAFTVWDQDGQKGQGVSHWVAYGFAPSLTSLAAGAVSAPGPSFVGGANEAKTGVLLGFCPPPGTAPHHYLFTIYALDLAPSALPPGLARTDFFAAIKGHTLDVTSYVGLFGR